MMKIVIAGLAFALVVVVTASTDVVMEKKEKLSDYGFFEGDMKALIPVEGVYPYFVNSPLFSNYADKMRFVRLPEGPKAKYNDSSAFEFPEGTILIKNFYYLNDFRSLADGRRIIETRLLVRQANGWEAWPYIWNDEQTEAYYDPAGDKKDISYVDTRGRKRTVSYSIPNRNQCKGCHVSSNKMQPIGVSARQLNGSFFIGGKEQNQLDFWVKNNLLEGAPSSEQAPRLVSWEDATGTLRDRARSYLDSNCGHCHSKNGPANTSGLHLDIHESRRVHLGVNKTPVAAGRGAGNLKYDIVPGKPDQSILLYRMKTNDPAIAMPELGREQVHEEGVALIEEWVRKGEF
jgi:uncharacterized repeat protein (TIGR03806 family)